MKHSVHPFTVMMMAIVISGFAASATLAQDAAKVAATNYKLVMENDRVRVFDAWFKPGDKAAMHSHPFHLAYIVSGGKAKFTTADGKATEIEAKTGQTLWLEPTTHTVENIGTTELRVLVIDLKEPAMPPKK